MALSHDQVPVPRVTDGRLVRQRQLWVGTAVLVGAVTLALTLIYIAGIANPGANLHRFPIAVVNNDAGAVFGGRQVNLGQQVAQGLAGAPDPQQRLDLRLVSLTQAQAQLDTGRVYGAVVIPADFSASLAALTRPPAGNGASARPTINLLTNPRAGSLGVSLTTATMTPALAAVSKQIGQSLTRLAGAAGPPSSVAAALQLADPVAVSTVGYKPLPGNAGFGLTSFYYGLIAVLAGFLGASIIGPTIDSALGYGATEVGPNRRQRLPVSITRTDTLLAKWAISVGLAPLLAGLIVVGGALILRVYTPYPLLLWAFLTAVVAVVGIGTQALLAAFGTLGQLFAMLIFVALALPSSGGTVPLQAVPSFYRVVATFEPLRPILDGIRAIMYFDARADAGLARAWLMTAVGLVVWIAFGLTVTLHYDRRGLYRIKPDVLQALYATLPAYQARVAARTPTTSQALGHSEPTARAQTRSAATAHASVQQPDQRR